MPWSCTSSAQQTDPPLPISLPLFHCFSRLLLELFLPESLFVSRKQQELVRFCFPRRAIETIPENGFPVRLGCVIAQDQTLSFTNELRWIHQGKTKGLIGRQILLSNSTPRGRRLGTAIGQGWALGEELLPHSFLPHTLCWSFYC